MISNRKLNIETTNDGHFFVVYTSCLKYFLPPFAPQKCGAFLCTFKLSLLTNQSVQKKYKLKV